jgi:hypothetical protein
MKKRFKRSRKDASNPSNSEITANSPKEVLGKWKKHD